MELNSKQAQEVSNYKNCKETDLKQWGLQAFPKSSYISDFNSKLAYRNLVDDFLNVQKEIYAQ